MKVYSEAYSGTILTGKQIEETKLDLCNQSSDKLTKLIAAEATKAATRPINRVKDLLGLKRTTPLPIRALSDLYQTTRFVDGDGEAVEVPRATNPWNAASLYALHKPLSVCSSSPLSSSHSSTVQLTALSSGKISRTSTLQFSETVEIIPPGPWVLSEAKRQRLTPLTSLDDVAMQTLKKRAQKIHAEKAAGASDHKHFPGLKFII